MYCESTSTVSISTKFPKLIEEKSSESWRGIEGERQRAACFRRSKVRKDVRHRVSCALSCAIARESLMEGGVDTALVGGMGSSLCVWHHCAGGGYENGW